MPKAVGIDLGTTNSAVAVVERPGEDPLVITTAEGSRLCPSVVGFSKTGERLVGQLAKRQAVLLPQSTIYSIKRFVGRRWDEVESERAIVPYKVVAGKNGMSVAEIGGRQYTPEEISSMVLQKLKKDAESYLGEAVNDAVITVPAYFNDAQRNATKVAGEIAGFNVLRIINEPTAASIAYGVDRQDKAQTILVWDLGGGTFDVTVLHMGGGVLEVMATNGDTHLGGDDWDEALVNHLADEFRRENGIDVRKDAQALQRLREAAEKAKIELSTVGQTNINLPFLTADATGPKHLDVTLTRAKFEELTKPLLDRCVKPFESALADAKIKASGLEEVVLVGGSTRMPMIQELVQKLAGKEPRKGVNPDEVVAAGAAIQAAVLTGEQKGIVLVDVTPLSLGVETQGGVMTTMIPRNTAIPCDHTEVYTTAADFQPSVSVKILQGERPLARDNRVLGNFELSGIPPAPKGIPQIEVKLEVDANGILHVSARDRGTGKAQNVSITGSTTLSKQDIDRMVREAEAHADEDQRRRDAIDLRNQGERLVHQAEQMLGEYGERIPTEDRSGVESAVSAMRGALAGEDPATLRAALGTLEDATRRAGEAIYRAASASEPADASDDGETEAPGSAAS
jgi:molecular chaperone DnaK